MKYIAHHKNSENRKKGKEENNSLLILPLCVCVYIIYCLFTYKCIYFCNNIVSCIVIY